MGELHEVSSTGGALPRLLERVRSAPDLAVLLPLALAAVVYFPLTRVYFVADDFSKTGAMERANLEEVDFKKLGAHRIQQAVSHFVRDDIRAFA